MSAASTTPAIQPASLASVQAEAATLDLITVNAERAIRELRRVKNPQKKAEILRIAAELAGKGRPTFVNIPEDRIGMEGTREENLRTILVKLAELGEAAEVVKEFLNSPSCDELNDTELEQLSFLADAMVQYTKKLKALAA